jgi:adenylosuccinate synthase
MPTAKVIIGANFGDEGKGKIVDYFAAKLSGPKVVCRHHSGAQAGHTVVTSDKQRHVFSHFGSGTFAGCSTYLAKHFVCNPLLFWRELRQLHDLGVNPEIGVDPRCFITTPYDMLVNQMVEDKRGDNRHGSVGVGFGETIERCNYPGFKLWHSDLSDHTTLVDKLKAIRDNWFPSRCRQLFLPQLLKTDNRLSDSLLLKFAESCTTFRLRTIAAGAEFLERKSVIFEGAQGLALDMNSENFPHVTRSNTGLTNVMPLAKVLALELDIIYVTRSFLTKHGAGSFPGECLPPKPIRDNTNIEHPYQGRLRYAPLDIGKMVARIDKDISDNAPGHPWSLAMTWCDWKDGVFPHVIPSLKGHGPRRDQIEER